MTLRVGFAFAAALSAGLAGRAAGQTATAAHHPVRIVEVRDAITDEPIVGADIVDLITKRATRTDETGGAGLFTPQFVNADGAVLRIAKGGYEPVGPLIVDPLLDSTLVVVLTRIVRSLPAVTTTARFDMSRDRGERDGIATRCASKFDACIGKDELARSPLKSISDFLRVSPGVVVKCAQGGADFDTRSLGSITLGPRGRAPVDGSQAHTTCSASMRRLDAPPGSCVPTFFVNGLEQPFAKTFASLTDQIDAAYSSRDVVTIEVFDTFSPRPLRWTGDPFCGAIVVWTKR